MVCYRNLRKDESIEDGVHAQNENRVIDLATHIRNGSHSKEKDSKISMTFEPHVIANWSHENNRVVRIDCDELDVINAYEILNGDNSKKRNPVAINFAHNSREMIVERYIPKEKCTLLFDPEQSTISMDTAIRDLYNGNRFVYDMPTHLIESEINQMNNGNILQSDELRNLFTHGVEWYHRRHDLFHTEGTLHYANEKEYTWSKMKGDLIATRFYLDDIFDKLMCLEDLNQAEIFEEAWIVIHELSVKINEIAEIQKQIALKPIEKQEQDKKPMENVQKNNGYIVKNPKDFSLDSFINAARSEHDIRHEPEHSPGQSIKRPKYSNYTDGTDSIDNR